MAVATGPNSAPAGRGDANRWASTISSSWESMADWRKPGWTSTHGKVTVNVLPRPNSLTKPISPPSSLHSSLTIDNPRPVPEYSRVRLRSPTVRELCRNFSKMISRSSSGIPTPVSATEICSRSSRLRRTDTVIRPPSGVNLMALDSKLIRTCWILLWSWNMTGKSGSTSQIKSMFFSSLSGRTISHWAVTTVPMRNSVSRTSILPASILARSRMSLIRSSSRRPDLRMF